MATRASFARFRTRLALLILLLVIPAFGLVLYANLQQRRIERASAREGASALSQLAAADERYFVQNARQLLTTLSQLPFLVLATNAPFCEIHFANLRKLSPDYIDFGLIERDGTLFCTADPTNGLANYAGQACFQRVVRTRKFAVGDFPEEAIKGERALDFGYPIFDERGRLKRVLFASLKLSRLSEAIKLIQLPADGRVTVFDRMGNVLAAYPEAEKFVGKSATNTAFIRRSLARPDDIFEMADADGVPQLHAVTSITEGQSASMFVSVSIPLNVSLAHSNEALLLNTTIAFLVAAAVLLGARFYVRKFILQPVNALSGMAQQLASGNLNARTGKIQGADELVELGQTLDQMAQRLQQRQAEIAEAHAEISRMNEELERRVEQRTSQLEIANKELEAFSYSVSHDLRAPIRHINGFVGMLSNDLGSTLGDRGRRFLKNISESGRHMGKLVDDLLAFSRMARVELKKDPVDLAGLVREVIDSLQAEMAEREVVWRIGKLPEVQADGPLLRQVMLNLVSNALKYSRTRSPALIEIGSLNIDGDQVFFVRDNGVGFDMEYVGKLFGVFQRLHHTDDFEGTGIGLANVRRIVLRHGGRTWAEGKVGEGATFYFTLPR